MGTNQRYDGADFRLRETNTATMHRSWGIDPRIDDDILLSLMDPFIPMTIQRYTDGGTIVFWCEADDAARVIKRIERYTAELPPIVKPTFAEWLAMQSWEIAV